MRESLKNRLYRWYMNFYPPFFGTGATVRYIADDWKEIQVDLPLNWRTRNLVGTIFGGSLYSAVDPFYMLMLIRLLGPAYLVWDKAASIRFKKPGKSRLRAVFTIDDGEIQTIKELLEKETKIDRVYQVDLVDQEGTVHASVEKVINIRKR